MSLPPIDELMAMDSNQLDELKERELAEIYNSVDDERRGRLIQLQWKVDATIAAAPNKMAGMLKIKSMMNESVLKLIDQLQKAVGNK